MLRIASKNEAFRRCGVKFTRDGMDFADDRFSAKEIKMLQAEHMLIVQKLPGKPAAKE